MKNMAVKFDPSLAKELSRLCLKRKVKTKQTPVLWIWWNAVYVTVCWHVLQSNTMCVRDATTRGGLGTESCNGTLQMYEGWC